MTDRIPPSDDPPPAYPGDDQLDDPPSPGRSTAAVIAIAVAVLAVVLIIALHLTGTIGPGAH